METAPSQVDASAWFAFLPVAGRLRLFLRGREVRGDQQRHEPGDKIHRQGEAPSVRQPLNQAASTGRTGPGLHRSRRRSLGRKP